MDAFITQIYNGFIQQKKIDPKYVSREECIKALKQGKKHHGTKGWKKYLKKTLRKIPDCNKKTHSTHIGTFKYFAEITSKNVEKEKEELANRIALAAQQEKEELIQRLTETQTSLNNLNQTISDLNTQRTEDSVRINDLNTQIRNLQTQLQASNSSNQQLVSQISELQNRSISIQTQLLERISRLERLMEEQNGYNMMIRNTNNAIQNLTNALRSCS